MKPGDRVRIKRGSLLKDNVGTVEVLDYGREYSVYVKFDSWSHWLKPEELELVSLPLQEERPEGERLREFFFGKPKQYEGMAKAWRDDGRCPRCGEIARIHLSTFICPIHGEFE